jgi:hypothetical protein
MVVENFFKRTKQRAAGFILKIRINSDQAENKQDWSV